MLSEIKKSGFDPKYWLEVRIVSSGLADNRFNVYIAGYKGDYFAEELWTNCSKEQRSQFVKMLGHNYRKFKPGQW